MKVELTQGPGYHLLVPSQYMGGGPLVNGSKGCVWQWGEKKSIIGFLLRPLLGKCFAWMAFLPKDISTG